MQASLQQQLLRKCSEVEALQEQNRHLRAEVSALQQHLASTNVAVSMHQVQGVPDQVASEHELYLLHGTTA